MEIEGKLYSTAQKKAEKKLSTWKQFENWLQLTLLGTDFYLSVSVSSIPFLARDVGPEFQPSLKGL